jgi:hypothetical protein
MMPLPPLPRCACRFAAWSGGQKAHDGYIIEADIMPTMYLEGSISWFFGYKKGPSIGWVYPYHDLGCKKTDDPLLPRGGPETVKKG